MGPGQLLRQRWAGAERRWRTFCYELPLPCSPYQLGLAVGPLAAEAATHVPKQAPAAAAGTGDGGAQEPRPQQAQQFTHFAPQQLPAELAVAAVLAVPPSVNGRSDSKPGSAGAAGKGGSSADASSSRGGGLSRSAHFFGLAFSFFEELLGARFPLPTMQQAGGFAPSHNQGRVSGPHIPLCPWPTTGRVSLRPVHLFRRCSPAVPRSPTHGAHSVIPGEKCRARSACQALPARERLALPCTYARRSSCPPSCR